MKRTLIDAKQELIDVYQSKIKNLEDENRQIKHELAVLKELSSSLRIENQYLKDRDGESFSHVDGHGQI
jgi:regulator of replication initiation timing